MRISALPALAVLSCLAGAINAVSDPEAALAALFSRTTEDILNSLDAQEAALKKRGIQATCTRKNIVYRYEL
jgi:tyrosinase